MRIDAAGRRQHGCLGGNAQGLQGPKAGAAAAAGGDRRKIGA